jgi:hypothetical protein
MIDIPVQLRSADELFDQFDPSPTGKRRLSDAAVSYLMASLKQAAAKDAVAVTLHLPTAAKLDSTEADLRSAVTGHFRRLADVATAEMHQVRLLARIFVPLGFVIMCLCMVVNQVLISWSERHSVHSIAEGVLVLGWVALWAPFDFLLFGRLPIRKERSYYRRLAGAEVRFQDQR